jgi:hypothetical protein
VAYLGEVLTDPLTKKQSLITTMVEVFSNILREATRSRLEKVVAVKGDFIH